MSGGIWCTCEGPLKERKKNFRVTQRMCNYSYFEYPKGQKHSSDWSEVRCLKCRARWRSRAKYVDDLPDYDPKEISADQKRLLGLD